MTLMPLYAAGIVGPALGAVVVHAGLPAPFFLGAATLLIGGVAVARRQDRRPRRTSPEVELAARAATVEADEAG